MDNNAKNAKNKFSALENKIVKSCSDDVDVSSTQTKSTKSNTGKEKEIDASKEKPQESVSQPQQKFTLPKHWETKKYMYESLLKKLLQSEIEFFDLSQTKDVHKKLSEFRKKYSSLPRTSISNSDANGGEPSTEVETYMFPNEYLLLVAELVEARFLPLSKLTEYVYTKLFNTSASNQCEEHEAKLKEREAEVQQPNIQTKSSSFCDTFKTCYSSNTTNSKCASDRFENSDKQLKSNGTSVGPIMLSIREAVTKVSVRKAYGIQRSSNIITNDDTNPDFKQSQEMTRLYFDKLSKTVQNRIRSLRSQRKIRSVQIRSLSTALKLLNTNINESLNEAKLLQEIDRLNHANAQIEQLKIKERERIEKQNAKERESKIKIQSKSSQRSTSAEPNISTSKKQLKSTSNKITTSSDDTSPSLSKINIKHTQPLSNFKKPSPKKKTRQQVEFRNFFHQPSSKSTKTPTKKFKAMRNGTLKDDEAQPNLQYHSWERPPNSIVAKSLRLFPSSSKVKIKRSLTNIFELELKFFEKRKKFRTRTYSTKTKFLQFWEDCRPAFFDTFIKPSKILNGRNQNRKDASLFDYDVDSEAEQEAEGEEGEDLDDRNVSEEDDDELHDGDSAVRLRSDGLVQDDFLIPEDDPEFDSGLGMCRNVDARSCEPEYCCIQKVDGSVSDSWSKILVDRFRIECVDEDTSFPLKCFHSNLNTHGHIHCENAQANISTPTILNNQAKMDTKHNDKIMQSSTLSSHSKQKTASMNKHRKKSKIKNKHKDVTSTTLQFVARKKESEVSKDEKNKQKLCGQTSEIINSSATAATQSYI